MFKIFLSRTLSTELLGIYTIVTSVFIVFATILNSGMELASSKNTTIYYNKDEKKCNGGITSSLIISSILFIIILILIILIRPLLIAYFGNKLAYNLFITMIPALLFTALYSPFKGYLWGREKFFSVAFLEFIEQLCRIISFFVFIFLATKINPLYSTGISLSLGCGISFIIAISLFFYYKGKLSTPKNIFKPILKSSIPITLVRFASCIIQPLLVFILPIQLTKVGYSHSQALSQLGVAMGMSFPLLSIPSTFISALAMVMLPKITNLNNNNNKTILKKQINSIVTFTLCCSFIVIPIFISLGEPLCNLVFNNVTAGTYIKYCSWIIVPICISQITTTILNSLNLELKTFIYSFISHIFLIVNVFILPKFIGIYTLMIGLGLSMSIISILNIYKINKTLQNKIPCVKNLIKLIFLTVPITLFTKWLYNLFIFIFPIFINICLCSIISFILYFIFMVILNIINVDYFKYVINKQKNKYKIIN